MSNILYSNGIGSLMYAMVCTHLDIAFAVRLVNRYQYNPGLAPWKVVKCYLKGTAPHFLT